MLTNLFAVIIALVVFFVFFISISNFAGKSIDEKDKRDKEVTEDARVFFKRHLNPIEEYIIETLPGMRGGINPINIIVLSNYCCKIITLKEKEEIKDLPNFNNSPVGKKLQEMVHTYVSFLIDKHGGGLGSSYELLKYNYGIFLIENDISRFYFNKKTGEWEKIF